MHFKRAEKNVFFYDMYVEYTHKKKIDKSIYVYNLNFNIWFCQIIPNVKYKIKES